MRLLLRITMAVGLATAAGLAQAPQKPVLSISTARLRLVSGACLSLTVRLTNSSPGAIMVGTPPGNQWPAESVFTLEVTGPGSAASPRTAYGRGARAGSISGTLLHPGQTLISQTMPTRLFDMTVPGQYRLTATVAVGPSDTHLRSNQLTITVIPPGSGDLDRIVGPPAAGKQSTRLNTQRPQPVAQAAGARVPICRRQVSAMAFPRRRLPAAPC